MSTSREHYRALVADVAARAKAILPAQVNGRIEKAVALVLQGDVEPQEDGSIVVHSATDATRRYVLQGTSCTCADYERGQAPSGWCAHRIASGIRKRVHELLPQSTPVETAPVHGDSPPPRPAAGSREELELAWGAAVPRPAPATLPEAPASVNVHLTIAGRQVQLTLRDSDEGRLLQRLQAVLDTHPLEAARTAQEPGPEEPRWCPKHGDKMQLNQKEGRSWYSHKTADGWCKGK
jgi:hypothetical protein